MSKISKSVLGFLSISFFSLMGTKSAQAPALSTLFVVFFISRPKSTSALIFVFERANP
jgi:hypothetical protein